MKRRGFFKAIAGLALVPTSFLIDSYKPSLTLSQRRESIIAAALETQEGKEALAQAMVEPIKRALEYRVVGRKLLMVDELPQGALARYEKDVTSMN